MRPAPAVAVLVGMMILVAFTDFFARNRAEEFLTESAPPLKSQPPFSRRAVGTLAGRTPSYSRLGEDVYRFDGLFTNIDVVLQYSDSGHLSHVETRRTWKTFGFVVLGVFTLAVLLWWAVLTLCNVL
jgi:hypothetical protein